MNVWGITDRGVIREQNQDAFAHQVLPDGRVLALVCDGMGGARAGNVASTMAVDIIMDEFLAEEEGERPGEMPSLILRKIGREETLWAVAKQYRTTCRAILDVNEIADEEHIPLDRLLLIPRAR